MKIDYSPLDYFEKLKIVLILERAALEILLSRFPNATL